MAETNRGIFQNPIPNRCGVYRNCSLTHHIDKYNWLSASQRRTLLSPQFSSVLLRFRGTVRWLALTFSAGSYLPASNLVCMTVVRGSTQASLFFDLGLITEINGGTFQNLIPNQCGVYRDCKRLQTISTYRLSASQLTTHHQLVSLFLTSLKPGRIQSPSARDWIVSWEDGGATSRVCTVYRKCGHFIATDISYSYIRYRLLVAYSSLTHSSATVWPRSPYKSMTSCYE